MGFRQGAFAKVWSVEDKGNYSTARITISKKDKSTDAYKTEFQDGFVRLVGQAHDAFKSVTIGEKGVTIRISSCDVTNNYSEKDKKTYINFVIFGFEFPDGNDGNGGNNTTSPSAPAKHDSFMNIPDDANEELPFN